MRHGGIESVPADDIEECSDERCADIKGACGDQVGTCWVEARCGGGRSQDDQVKVERSLLWSRKLVVGQYRAPLIGGP